jgi:hypothetical protein
MHLSISTFSSSSSVASSLYSGALLAWSSGPLSDYLAYLLDSYSTTISFLSLSRVS